MRHNILITAEDGFKLKATNHGWAKKDQAIRKMKSLRKKDPDQSYKLIEQEKFRDSHSGGQ